MNDLPLFGEILNDFNLFDAGSDYRYQDKGEYIEFTVDVPGIEQKDLKINLTERYLTVKGETGDRGIDYTFQTPFKSEEADIQANLSLGVLTIKMQKPLRTKTRSIEIT